MAGEFIISNQYHTVEFRSDVECGMNACGETIYCLPGSSHLKVELTAAALQTCSEFGGCDLLAPYDACSNSNPAQGNCQDPNSEPPNKNYPTSGFPFSGIMDSVFNSLDGNRNENAQGTSTTPYNENEKYAAVATYVRAGADREDALSAVNTAASFHGVAVNADVVVDNVFDIINAASIVSAVGSATSSIASAITSASNGPSDISNIDIVNTAAFTIIAAAINDGSNDNGIYDILKTEIDAVGDNFEWSFFVNDEIEDESPKIATTSVAKDEPGVDQNKPVDIEFDKIMMSSSLGTRSVVVKREGEEDVVHQRINLFNYTGDPLYYYTTNNDEDKNIPLDGRADRTIVHLNHTALRESQAYKARVGSGVKDVYQNCFKPSAGPACSDVSESKPSCCNGEASENECE